MCHRRKYAFNLVEITALVLLSLFTGAMAGSALGINDSVRRAEQRFLTEADERKRVSADYNEIGRDR